MGATSLREAAIFSAARRLPAEERAFYLDGACAGDAVLRRQIEELLRAEESAGPFLAELAARAGAAPDPGETRRVAPDPSEGPGDIIDRYKLMEQVGEGGCGVVYVAEQTEPVRRRVALKVIKLGMDTKAVVARFEAERQALAMMDHPNIAKVLDAGTTLQGRPYFVMELVRGIRITDYCDQANLSTRQRLELFIPICQAIQHAHQKGIIHRDIKPSNILVTMHDGVPVPKVIDFGIAKATEGRLTDATVYTQLHQFIGTPAYMSPEQAEMSGLDIDTRSDIYSLGVLLYELLVGSTPFDAQELVKLGLDEMRQLIREKEPVRPSTKLTQALVAADVSPRQSVSGLTVPTAEEVSADSRRRLRLKEQIARVKGDLDWIVMKCLEKDRTRRYETANGLSVDLKRHLNNEPVSARPPSNLYRFQKAFRRNKLAFGAAGAVAASVVLGLIAATWQAHVARVAQRDAVAARKAAESEKERADTKAGEAQAQREAARGAEADARRQVVRLTVANGARLHDEGRIGEALLWFARSLSVVEGDPKEERIHRLRFASVLRECPHLEQIFQHSNVVGHVEFSPKTARFVVTTTDFDRPATARVWDTVTGEPVTAGMPHDDRVRSASFSPDGRLVVTAGRDGTARVWEATTGQPITRPLKHDKYVSSAIFSPDGQQVLTSSLDKTARLWNARTGEPLLAPLDHGEELGMAVFSPDGRLIATAGGDSTARTWDAKTGQPLSRLLKHESGVGTVMFFPDGQRLMTASWDRTVRIWDAVSGRQIGEPMRHKSGVISASLNPEGAKIVSRTADETGHVWDVASATELRSFSFKNDMVGVWGQSFLPTFSPDGRFIMIVDKDGAGRLLDSNTCEPVLIPFQHNGRLVDASFSRDSRHLVTSSMDHTARVWDISTAPEANPGMRYRLVVNTAARSHDGRRVVVTGADRAGQVVEISTGKVIPLKSIEGSIRYAAFSSDDQAIVTVSDNVRVWNAETGAPLTQTVAPKEPVYFAFFSPDGRRFAVSSGLHQGTVSIYETATGRQLGKSLEHSDYVEHLTFSADGARVITSSADGTARVWSAATGEAITPGMTHGAGVAYAAFSPDGRMAVTASYDKTARVWDANTGEPITGSLRHAYAVRQAEFTSDNQRIVTACEDGLRAWKLATDERPVADLVQLAQVLTGMQINAGGAIASLRVEDMWTAWQALRTKYPGDSMWNGASGVVANELTQEEQSQCKDSLLLFHNAQILAAAAAKFEPFPVDLSGFYNGRLTNDWLNTNPGQPTPGFRNLPLGLQKFADTTFDVRGVVQVAGQATRWYGPEFPDRVRDIRVNRKCRLIHFLHGAVRTDKDQRLGSYILRFAGGLVWDIPILGGYDVHSLGSPLALGSPKNSVIAWTGSFESTEDPARLYKTTWEIPWPDLLLESVDVIGNMSFGAPFLVGITVE